MNMKHPFASVGLIRMSQTHPRLLERIDLASICLAPCQMHIKAREHARRDEPADVLPFLIPADFENMA